MKFKTLTTIVLLLMIGPGMNFLKKGYPYIRTYLKKVRNKRGAKKFENGLSNLIEQSA